MTHKKRITKIIASVLSVVMVLGFFTFLAPDSIVLTASAVSYEDNGVTNFTNGDAIKVINTMRASKSEATYTTTDGVSWTTTDAFVWNGGVMYNQFRAWYPATDTTSYESFKIPTDQADGVQAADWMTASTGEITKPDDCVLNLTFQHRLAKVTVSITNWNNEFDGAAKVIDDLQIYTKGTDIRVDPVTGVCSSNGTLEGIDPYVDDTSYTAIVAPAAYDANDKFMTFTVDGKEMTVLATASQLTNGLEPGNHYTFDLTVGKNAVEITGVTVNGWKEEDMNGGVAEEIHYEYDAETNTYIVDNAEGLQQWNKKVQEVFATAVDGGSGLELEYAEDFPNLTLEADITLTGENNWTPLGGRYTDEENYYYNGVIDGNGHTITGLRINSNSQYQGFIGKLDYRATVKNLTFADAVVSGGGNSGIVVGEAQAGRIENCHVTSGSLTATGSNAGGIVGNNIATVINCTNAATIAVAEGATGVLYVGGIAGYNIGTIMGCTNTGAVSGNSFVGGIVGMNSNRTGIVVACGSKGEVTGTDRTGGIIGFNGNSGSAYGSWTITTTEFDTTIDGIGNTSTLITMNCFSGDAATINSKVENMNAAIATYNASAAEGKTCPYIWQVGEDGYPTLVEVTE